MFFRFILGALRYRKQRLTIAFAALAVAATLSTVLFGIYGTIEQRIRDEFSAYGANIVVRPETGSALPLGIADAAAKMGLQVAPFVVVAGDVGGTPVAVIGFEPALTEPITPYWHVTGSRDIQDGECLAGERAAAQLNLTVGSTVPLKDWPCRLKGIISTGAQEDNQIFVPLWIANNKLLGSDVVPDTTAGFLEIRAPGDRVEAVRAALANQFPRADVRTIVAVAATESNVVLKIRASLFLLTLLILAITTLCVSSNFSEMVIERSKEIGILKALGAAERRIAAFFVSEAAALALLAALAGYCAGVFAAAGIGEQVFGGAFHPQGSWLVFGGVVAVMLAVAAVATGIAASRIWGIQPAIVLRGE